MSALASLSRSSFGLAAAVATAAGVAVRPLKQILTALKHRRQVVDLLEADPGMLRDLGLTPMDVHGALAEPLWRDPSARLLIWSVERRAASRAAAKDNLLGLSPDRNAGPAPLARCA